MVFWNRDRTITGAPIIKPARKRTEFDYNYLEPEDRRRLERPMDHSLTFALLLYINVFYFGLYACVEFGFLCFKTYHMYESGDTRLTSTTLINEMLILTFLVLVESIRLVLGQKHQLDDFDKGLSNIFRILVLTVPSMYSVFYFTLWQNIVTRLDMVLGGIMLVIQTCQFLSAFLSIWVKFWKKTS